MSETRNVSCLLFETLNMFYTSIRNVYSIRRLGSGIYIGCSALEETH